MNESFFQYSPQRIKSGSFLLCFTKAPSEWEWPAVKKGCWYSLVPDSFLNTVQSCTKQVTFYQALIFFQEKLE